MNLMQDIEMIRKGFIIVGIIFSICGILILVREILKRKKCKKITSATVIDIVKEFSRDSDRRRCTYFYPIFEYNAFGKMYEKKSELGTSICNYNIGQVIEILYNPENPNEYYVKGSFGSMVIGLLCSIMGIGAIIIGITFVFF